MVAELYTAVSGLGGLLALYGSRFQMAEYLAVVVVLALIGVTMTEGLRLVETAAAALARRPDMNERRGTRRREEDHAASTHRRRRSSPACSPLPAAAEPFRLIVTDMEAPLVPNSVMELAEQEGYFDRAGVDVEFVRVQQTPLAMAALRAGEGEMANVALEALLQATAAGRRPTCAASCRRTSRCPT